MNYRYLFNSNPDISDQLALPFNTRIAEAIKRQRIMLQLSKSQLAEKSGVNRVTIAKVEDGKQIPSAAVITKILDALELDVIFIDRNRGGYVS